MEVMLSWYTVNDLEAAKRFYGETLGLNKVFEMDGWAEFSHGEGQPAIGLSQANDATAEGGATVVLRVDNLAAAQAELQARGVEFTGETEEVPGVVRIATFRDSSGNRLQLIEQLLQQ